jgi:hypothetical protein
LRVNILEQHRSLRPLGLVSRDVCFKGRDFHDFIVNRVPEASKPTCG